jgi:uncharacterized protein YbaP (TraB family)
MLKNRILFTCVALIALLSCSTGRGVGATDTAPHPQDTVKLDNALLWRITRPDIKQESYLFGTIHLIDADSYFLPAGTELVMERADKFVFEIDMAEMMDIGAQFSMITKAFMKDGTRLKDLVSTEDYELIEEHFAGVGLPMMMLDRIKPLFLTVFASPEMDPNSLSSGEMMSYEMEFYEYAQNQDKTTGGLETMEFQLSVFDSIPYKAQAEMLVESLRVVDDGSDALQEMIDLYLTQNVEALYAVIGDDTSGAGPYEDILLNNRNKKWIAGITDYMKTGSVFFAVGAGHLGGPQGVIRLLQKAGFTVSPILQVENSSRETKKF